MLPTLRRLFLARSPTGHLALLPVEIRNYEETPPSPSNPFACPCGETFDATFELSSWTTEYTPRCLQGFKPIIDNRRTTH